ncbi:MAG: prolyl oligopeptidase family serine peptidase [Alphaproteobacteria bacterium]|nr:prolyl oligopeptidase family serine peptidase [Alphaproteobacteria bacterium]
MRIIKASDIFFFCLVLSAGVGLALWLRIWNPDTLLRQALPIYQLANEIDEMAPGARGEMAPGASGEAPRLYKSITLANADGGEIRFTLSLPSDVDLSKAADLPSLVMLTGFRAGRHSLDLIENHGRNAIIAYDYPYDPDDWRNASIFGRVWIAHQTAYRMPDEVAGLIAWVQRQPWADPDRVNLAGVSLGAIALPIAQRRAASTGHKVAASILAYGGLDLHALARTNLKDAWYREPLALAAALMLRPLAPVHHLPKLSGPFLLIHGDSDERIPKDSLTALNALTPEPKTILVQKGAHIDGRRPEIIQRTVDTARKWLREQDLLNP